MNAAHECWRRNLEGLERLGRVGHVPPEYLALRVALYRAQTAVYDALAGDTPAPMPLQAGTLRFDPAAMARILASAAASLDSDTPAARDLARLIAGPAELPALAGAAMFGPGWSRLKELAAKYAVSEETALFFGRACGAPYVCKAVAQSAEMTGDNNDACPYCGSPPGLALLQGEDGHRVLVCVLCGRKRAFPRMKCPFCGKEGVLETIRDADTTARWIEGCGTCGGYLKAMDARTAGASDPVLPLVESVATLYLDLIAEKEGFRRGMPYVALN